MLGIGAGVIPFTTNNKGGGGTGAVDSVVVNVSSPDGTVNQPDPSSCQVVDGVAIVDLSGCPCVCGRGAYPTTSAVVRPVGKPCGDADKLAPVNFPVGGVGAGAVHIVQFFNGRAHGGGGEV